jgi:prevent-host-death family protein
MTKTISLRDANQTFARCVRAVEAGEEFVITRNGQPVAKLVPIAEKRILTPEQHAARERLRALMDNASTIKVSPFDRDSAHER